MSSKRKCDPIFFEVNVTPRAKKQNVDEPPAYLVLAPFNPLPKVCFENIKLGTSATRVVIIQNPSNNETEVELVKLPPEKRGLQFSATEFILNSGEEKQLIITWTPHVAASWREVVQLKSNNGATSSIVITCSAVEPPKVRKKNNRPLGIRNVCPEKKRASNSTFVAAGQQRQCNVKGKENFVCSLSDPTFCHGDTLLPPCKMDTPLRRQTYKIEKVTKGSSRQMLEVIPDSDNVSLQIRRATFQVSSGELPTLIPKSVPTENVVRLEDDSMCVPMSSSAELPTLLISKSEPTENFHDSLEDGSTVVPMCRSNIDEIVKEMNFSSSSDSIALTNDNFDSSLLGKLSQSNSKTSLECSLSPVLNKVESDSCVPLNVTFSPIKLNSSSGTYSKVSPCSLFNNDICQSEGRPTNIILPYKNQHNKDISHLKYQLNNAPVTRRFLFEDSELWQLSPIHKSFNEVSQSTVKCSDCTSLTNINYMQDASHLCFDVNDTRECSRRLFDDSEQWQLSPGMQDSSEFIANKDLQSTPSGVHFISTPTCHISQLKDELRSEGIMIKQGEISPLKQHLSHKVSRKNDGDTNQSTVFSYNTHTDSYNTVSVNHHEKDAQRNSATSHQVHKSHPHGSLTEDDRIRDALDQHYTSSNKDAQLQSADSCFKHPGSAPKSRKQRIEPINDDKCSYESTSTSGLWNISPPKRRRINTGFPPYLKPARSEPLKVDSRMKAVSYKLRSYSKTVACSQHSAGNLKKQSSSLSYENISTARTSVKKSSALSQSARKSQPLEKVPQSGHYNTLKTSAVQGATNRESMQNEIATMKTPNLGSSQKKEIKWSSNSNGTEDVFQHFCNPDAFAASTNVDPFITSSMYYEEEWLERTERDLIKWLNALLTPPTELESSVEMSSGRINISELWSKSCRTRAVELAPSREVVSSLYHTNQRLVALRKAAAALFKSDQMASVLSKVVVYVNKKAIMVRDDRDLHLDQGLQCKVLGLLLCYNPLWLRIGLEAVFNCQIHLHSNSDIVGLTAFIRRRFLSDDYIKAKYSHQHVPHLMLQPFADAMKKFILRKFLMLVFFLDQAKSRKLISHDPCLFCKNSSFKDSRSILIEFSREILTAVGDIIKYLKRLGYKLQHKQTYLDEFDFSVVKRNDLRDGVRLTRAMEIILNKMTLCTELRVPAISKLQKVHNVKIALTALTDEGFEIVGDIAAKDIVEGHREKMLSLLWQIVYKFQAPRFTAAAFRIQRWWRENSLKFTIQIRINKKMRFIKNVAAIKIQLYWRGQIAKKRVKKLKEQNQDKRMVEKEKIQFMKQNSAAIIIQRYYRDHLKANMQKSHKIVARVEDRFSNSLSEVKTKETVLLEKTLAAMVIQKHVRKYLSAKKQNNQYLMMRSAAIAIQRYIRCKIESRAQRILFLNKKSAATLIQRYYRSYLAARIQKAKFLVKWSAATLIQVHYRNHLEAKAQRARFLGKRSAAVVIQRYYRNHVEAKTQRVRFMVKRNAAVVIQRFYRNCLEAKIQRARFIVKKNAAVVIQRYFRNHLETKKQRAWFLVKRNAAIVIQRYYWNHVEAQTQRARNVVKRNAAILIQRYYRNFLEIKTQRARYIIKRNAAIVIQIYYRNHLETKAQRAQFIVKRNAAVVIQRYYRNHLEAKIQRARFIIKKNAAVVIQRYIRNRLEAKTQRARLIDRMKAAIVIQRFYRSHLEAKTQRARFMFKRNAAIFIQRYYRNHLEAKTQRARFISERNAAIVIQRYFRSHLEAKTQRARFMVKRNAAVVIQRYFRNHLEAKAQQARSIAERSAAVIIQRFYRNHLEANTERALFVVKRNAAVVIQRYYRNYLEAKIQRARFVVKRNASVVIQRYYRNHLEAKSQRVWFIFKRNAAIVIQRYFRNHLEAKTQRARFLVKRDAAVVIQRYYRNYSEAKIQRARFIVKRNSAIVIQQYFRNHLEVKTQRARLMVKRNAAVVIQRYYRNYSEAKIQRARFLVKRNSAVVIQRYFRNHLDANTQRARFMVKRNAAVVIQRYYRNHLEAKSLRVWFIFKRNAAIVIQRYFRNHLEAKTQRARFLVKRDAAVGIQRFYRSHLEAKTQRTRFIFKRNAALVIQRYYRNYLEAKIQRARFVVKRNAAVFIQRSYRNHLKARAQRAQFVVKWHAAVVIQQHFRRHLEVKKQRALFLRMRSATAVIAQYYRNYLDTKSQRARFLNMRTSAMLIQHYYRRHLNLKVSQSLKNNAAAVVIQRYYRSHLVEKNDKNRQNIRLAEAATKIQGAWRGYKVRKVIKLASRSNANNGVVAKGNGALAVGNGAQILAQRLHQAQFKLKNVTTMADIIAAMITLDTATTLSPQLCVELVESGTLEDVYELLSSTNRSLSYQNAFCSALPVVINVARYSITVNRVWQRTLKCDGLSTLFGLMSKFWDKNPELFCMSGTVLWLFAQNKDRAKVIVEFPHAIQWLSNFSQQVTKKNTLAKARGKPIAAPVMPSKEPDWGLFLKPKAFNEPAAALKMLLKTLDLPLNNSKKT